MKKQFFTLCFILTGLIASQQSFSKNLELPKECMEFFIESTKILPKIMQSLNNTNCEQLTTLIKKGQENPDKIPKICLDKDNGELKKAMSKLRDALYSSNIITQAQNKCPDSDI